MGYGMKALRAAGRLINELARGQKRWEKEREKPYKISIKNVFMWWLAITILMAMLSPHPSEELIIYICVGLPALILFFIFGTLLKNLKDAIIKNNIKVNSTSKPKVYDNSNSKFYIETKEQYNARRRKEYENS